MGWERPGPQLSQFINGARYGMLHRQRTLHAARASRALASDHRQTLLVIGIRRENACETLLQNIANRWQGVASGQHIPIREHEHLQKSEHARRFRELLAPIILLHVFDFVGWALQ